MTRFSGLVGYVDTPVETAPGVHVESMVELSYKGTVVRNTRRLENGESVNDDISVNNSISIVADAYANEHFHAIRYVRWAGSTWRVVTVDVERPRLLLRLGGKYNGPTA
jgi:hypothetical protein